MHYFRALAEKDPIFLILMVVATIVVVGVILLIASIAVYSKKHSSGETTVETVTDNTSWHGPWT